MAAETIAVLRSAETYGLCPRDYDIDLPPADVQRVLSGRAEPGVQSRFDVALTESVARFAAHVHRGSVSSRAAGFDLPTARSEFDAHQAARDLAVAPDVAQAVSQLEPRLPPYR